MYFNKIELHSDATTARLSRFMHRDGYRLHQALWRLFKNSPKSRDFLYRRVERQGQPCFYVVSGRVPEDEDGIWAIRTKNYAPKLDTGQRLAFSLCANPVITRRNDKSGKPIRHDVVMDAKKHLKEDCPTAELIQQAGWGWLTAKAGKFGFRVERARIDGYRQHQFWKGKGQQPIRFSTLDFDGMLTVTDPEQLIRALFGGIGPAKGFGCGMLLVRRI